MEWFLAATVLAILGVGAVVAAGSFAGMSREPVRDVFRPELPSDRPLTAADLQELRFGVTIRGYAMDQVDEVLDRLRCELAEREGAVPAPKLASGPEESP